MMLGSDGKLSEYLGSSPKDTDLSTSITFTSGALGDADGEFPGDPEMANNWVHKDGKTVGSSSGNTDNSKAFYYDSSGAYDIV